MLAHSIPAWFESTTRTQVVLVCEASLWHTREPVRVPRDDETRNYVTLAFACTQSSNFAQKFDADLVRELLRPIVRDEIRLNEVPPTLLRVRRALGPASASTNASFINAVDGRGVSAARSQVDTVMRGELENLKLAVEKGKKKKKPKKKKKKACHKHTCTCTCTCTCTSLETKRFIFSHSAS